VSEDELSKLRRELITIETAATAVAEYAVFLDKTTVEFIEILSKLSAAKTPGAFFSTRSAMVDCLRNRMAERAMHLRKLQGFERTIASLGGMPWPSKNN
jgi:hypothetical protein